MKKLIGLAAAFLLLAIVHLDGRTLEGSWSGIIDGSQLNLSLQYGRFHQNGTRIPLAGTTLDPRAAMSATPLQTSFQLVRDAGSVHFDGSFRGGKGGGAFRFEPNLSYGASMQKLGVRGSKWNDEEELFAWAIHDVSLDFVRAMQGRGYNVDMDDYLGMRIHGVSPAFADEMNRRFPKKLSADQLMSVQIHGVTTAYMDEMQAAGYGKMDLDDLLSSRIHGVTPEFMREMKALGYDLSFDTATSFRIHGVTASYIKEVRSFGLEPDADDLVSMRIHGVTPAFIRRAREKGVRLTADRLVSLKIHGGDYDDEDDEDND